MDKKLRKYLQRSSCEITTRGIVQDLVEDEDWNGLTALCTSWAENGQPWAIDCLKWCADERKIITVNIRKEKGGRNLPCPHHLQIMRRNLKRAGLVYLSKVRTPQLTLTARHRAQFRKV